MLKQKYFNIIFIGFIQILIALYLLYILFLKVKHFQPLFIIFLISFIITLISTAFCLFKLYPVGRSISINNLMIISFLTIIAMSLTNSKHNVHFLIYLTILILSLYFIYFLTRKNVKELFHYPGQAKECNGDASN